jgi:hypothetical protein
MSLRPGGAPEKRKISQGMEAQSRLDLDFCILTLCPLCLCLPRRSDLARRNNVKTATKAGGKNLGNQLTQSHPVLPGPKPTEPTKNRVKLNQIKPKNNPTPPLHATL